MYLRIGERSSDHAGARKQLLQSPQGSVAHTLSPTLTVHGLCRPHLLYTGSGKQGAHTYTDPQAAGAPPALRPVALKRCNTPSVSVFLSRSLALSLPGSPELRPVALKRCPPSASWCLS
jgi:hypothetical protein